MQTQLVMLQYTRQDFDILSLWKYFKVKILENVYILHLPEVNNQIYQNGKYLKNKCYLKKHKKIKE